MKKTSQQLFSITSMVTILFFTLCCQNRATRVELDELKAQAEIEEQNKAILKEYWGRFGKGEDEKAVIAISRELHDSEIVFNTAQKNFGLNPYKALSDFRPEIENIIAEGDFVVVRFTVWGTHSSDLLGIPATGKQVSYPVQIMYRFQDGKVIEAWSDWDSLFDLMNQLGMELKPKEGEQPSPESH